MRFPNVSRFASIASGAFRLSIPALLAGSLLGGCNEKDTPNGTEVENEVGVGRLYLADGRPAPFATVRIFKVNEVPEPKAQPKRSGKAETVLITTTDAQGRYKVTSLANGEYNVLSSLDGLYGYQDSIPLGLDAGPVPSDTLLDPGVVRGYVGVQPQDDPRTVTVQLLGTNRFTNVDSAGRFEFRDLGGGAYTVRLVTTEPKYTTTYTSFKAVSGKEVELQDTLRLIFTGVGAVTGLTVRYDTLNGVALLRWNRVKHTLIQDYLVYRDEGDGVAPGSPQVAEVRDTVFADTLWSKNLGEPPVDFFDGFPQLLPFGDTARRPFTWRVRARIKTQDVGPFLYSTSAMTLSPFWVATQADIMLAGPHEALATVGDTVPLILTYRNPLHKIKNIRWYDDGGEPPLRIISLDTEAGTDTLVYRFGTTRKTTPIKAVLTDEIGATWTASLSIQVVDDDPQIGLTASASNVLFGDTLKLHATASDKGRIVKWEWSIGAGSPFIPTSRPDISFRVEIVPAHRAPLDCRVRATDEDGNITESRVEVDVTPWKNLADMPNARVDFTAIAMNGKIYAIGGSKEISFGGSAASILATVDAYNPATDSWEARAPMKLKRVGHAAVVYGNEILVTGGNNSSGKPLHSTEFYNPETDTWRDGPSLDQARAFLGLARQGSRVFAINGLAMRPTQFDGDQPFLVNRVEAFDAATNQWSAISVPDMPGSAYFHLAEIGGKIYSVGGLFPRIGFQSNLLTSVKIFDFSTNLVNQGVSLPYGHLLRASHAFGDRVLLAGGDRFDEDYGNGRSDLFEALDPVTGTSRTLSSISPARWHASMSVLDGKVYLLGGANRNESIGRGLAQVYALPLDSVLANP